MDLSIIIISFNTKKITEDCIESVIKNTKKINYTIRVVDNASSDGSFEYLSKRFAKYDFIRFIKSSNNLGFAKANNLGAKDINSRYILFLNSDTLIKENILYEMLEWMGKNKKTAAATCALKNKDGSFQGSGGYFPTLPRVFNWMFFIEDIPFIERFVKPFHPVHLKSPFYKSLDQFKKIRNQDWITGAFFLIRGDVFRKAGRFDEDYFMYTEEVDLCFRVKKLNYDIYYLPQWEIIHLGGASSNKEFPILSEYKGIKMFYRKNMPVWQYPFMRIFLKGGALIRALVYKLIGEKESYEIYVRAFKTA